METCPTQSEFVEIDITKPENQTHINLYKANKKLCMIIMLGKGKSHKMALLSKIKSDDPHGFAWEFIGKVKNANKLSDASPAIEMVVKLDQFQLKGARDFYNDIIAMMDKYKISKTDCKLCMPMA